MRGKEKGGSDDKKKQQRIHKDEMRGRGLRPLPMVVGARLTHCNRPAADVPDMDKRASHSGTPHATKRPLLFNQVLFALRCLFVACASNGVLLLQLLHILLTFV